MSRHQDKYSSTKDAGFTLVEALVSLVLLTTALVPAFILATDALKVSTGIRNSLIAANLAQEGVEVVRAIRDANWFVSTYPTTTFSVGLDSCGVATGCRVQWNSSSVLALAGNPPLKWDSTSKLYQYTTGTNSLFSRKITVVASATELVVKSEVTWVERTIPNTVIAEYHLFDWIK